ncbi:MAG: glutamate formimidoyltransferase [Bernardetiaceae bacterium]
MPIIECVPNFSEGQNPEVIASIAEAISGVDGVRLLHQDTGFAAHRTVMTFVGPPSAVVEAAFAGICVATEKIDMRQHHGTHPRFGATDVCPLVPLSEITMEQVVGWARDLARRVGENLDYPVFCYEAAALVEERRNLAFLRAGEYEGLAERLQHPNFQPDFGPAAFRPRTGASAIGAREFLLAVNFNLNTADLRPARRIAARVRESGYVRAGKRVPGRCPGTKAIGWYIEDFGIAQVSMNITRLSQTSLYQAFRVVSEEASQLGLRVTGTEIIGLVPSFVIEDTAEALGHDRHEVSAVIEHLGLDQLQPFIPEKKILP